MRTLTQPFERDRMEFIKNPTVAEFIGLAPNSDFSETELEGAIIGNLQKFLLELGKGFSFVARQKLIRTEKKGLFHRPRFLQLYSQIVRADRPQNDDHHPPRRGTDGYVRSDVRRACTRRGRQSDHRHRPLFGNGRGHRPLLRAARQRPPVRLEIHALYAYGEGVAGGDSTAE